MRKLYRHPFEFNDGYPTRKGFYDVTGHIVHLRIAVNNGGEVFPQGRILVGHMPESVMPASIISRPICGTSKIESMATKLATLVMGSDGPVYVDNFMYSDIMEFVIDVTYQIASKIYDVS